MIICENCGGKFQSDFSYCPYCGYANETAVHKHYEKEMEDIREDLMELPEETKEIYENTAKKEVVKALRIFLVIVLVILCLIFVPMAFLRLFDGESASLEKQLKWERQYFPILDDLYAKKDYEGIIKFKDEHAEDEGECFYLWENYDFLYLYENYQTCVYQKEIMNKNRKEDSVGDSFLIHDACQLVYFEEIYYHKEWEEEQLEALSVWKQEMEDFLRKDLGLNEQQLGVLEDAVNSKKYVPYSLCQQLEKQLR